MARLASDAKKGFYPTSTQTVKKIIDKTILFKEDRETVVVDSCSGEGEVLDFISNNYPCRSYAVELDEYRAKTAKNKNIAKVLNGDALYGVQKNTWWAGLNFLNPPYGTDSEGNRLEIQFVRAWGGVTSRMGVMILVISPSSNNDDMADILSKQGYKLICSVYDKDNEDYKSFGQYFLILQRIKNLREDKKKILNSFENKIEISELEIEKVEITTGASPQTFREYSVPKWKIDEAIIGSDIKEIFKDSVQSSAFSSSAIEQPNDGQAAILIASGIIDDVVELKIEGEMEEVILKGTVFKYQNTRETYDDMGNVKGIIESDAYKTELYALSLTKGEYIKCV